MAVNALLESLPKSLKSLLLARLKLVELPFQTVLYEPEEVPQYAHFLLSGVAAVVNTMSDGLSAEVGFWSHEGLVECFHLFGAANSPTRCFMQTEGTALRMSFREMQKLFLEHDALHAIILQCVQSQSSICAQIATCNRLHALDQRLARWLIILSDHTANHNVDALQEFIATMLSSTRTSVTLAAGSLQAEGLIQYTRGHVHILDADRLEVRACECCGIIRKLYRNFYPIA